jgi:hypothetical protein
MSYELHHGCVKECARLSANILKLLSLVAKECRACRACGMTIYMVEHANGKMAPYTADGVNHFANCPKAEQFRKPR